MIYHLEIDHNAQRADAKIQNPLILMATIQEMLVGQYQDVHKGEAWSIILTGTVQPQQIDEFSTQRKAQSKCPLQCSCGKVSRKKHGSEIEQKFLTRFWSTNHKKETNQNDVEHWYICNECIMDANASKEYMQRPWKIGETNKVASVIGSRNECNSQPA